MTLNQMRYFIEICKCGTISKAANKLYISQPTLTTALKDMETELGVNLFHRVAGRLILSKDGEFFFNRISPIVNEIDSSISDMRSFSKIKKPIRLGLPLQVGVFMIPILLGEFKNLYPDISFDVEEGGGLDIMQMVENENLDLAIANYETDFSSNLSYQKLFSSDCCFCVNKNSPLAQKKNIDVTDIINQPLAIIKGGFLINKYIHQTFALHNKQPNIILYTNQLHTVKSMVKNSLASTFLIKDAVLDEPTIVPIPLKNEIIFTGGIVTKRNRHLHNDTKKLIDFLTKRFL